jgi:dephospho-CoA kinase
MPLIYVTGSTAAGKSTLRRELARRGYAAFEAEDAPFSMWVDRKTGEPATYPKTAAHRTQTWLQDHVLLMSRDRVERLAAEARDKPVLLCGIPGNGHEMIELFERSPVS